MQLMKEQKLKSLKEHLSNSKPCNCMNEIQLQRLHHRLRSYPSLTNDVDDDDVCRLKLIVVVLLNLKEYIEGN